jgi:hypothetical protein
MTKNQPMQEHEVLAYLGGEYGTPTADQVRRIIAADAEVRAIYPDQADPSAVDAFAGAVRVIMADVLGTSEGARIVSEYRARAAKARQDYAAVQGAVIAAYQNLTTQGTADALGLDVEEVREVLDAAERD